MKIRMLSILSSPKYGNAQPGRILTVDEQDGRDLIAGHYAVKVQDEVRKDVRKEVRKEGRREEPKEEQESASGRESAMLTGGEQAMQEAANPRTLGKVE